VAWRKLFDRKKTIKQKLANIDVVVSEERVRWERARFDELATKYGGDYDGWEAAVSST
jgi:hypothetical protein